MNKVLLALLLLAGCAPTVGQAAYELRRKAGVYNIREKSYVLPWDCSGDYTTFRLEATTGDRDPVEAVVCCHYFQGCYVEKYTVYDRYHY